MMKRSKHPIAGLALILAAALFAFTPGLAAQSGGSAQEPGQQQPNQQQPSQQQSKTFAGKVVKMTNGQFALVTGQTAEGKATGHYLDNQDQAKQYEGKQVTVTGTLDEASNTIHVTNIQAA